MFAFSSRLRKLLPRSFRTSLRVAPRHQRSRPLGVEQLEDRLTPAGLADAGGATPLLANLVYHGGPLLANVQIEQIYLKDSLSGNESTYQAQLDAFFNTITTDSYIPTLLSEYSVPGYTIGTGTVGTDDVHVLFTPFSTSFTKPGIHALDDSQIRTLISNEIQAGNTATPNKNTLYVVLAPPGEAITLGASNTITGFHGYHSSFVNANGQPVYYAVIPDGDSPNNTTLAKTVFQQLTVVSSHEMSEAITDPAPFSGWVKNAQSTPFNAPGNEIGDLSEPQFYTQDGYVVQYEWSNTLQASAYAIGTTAPNLFIDQLMPPSAQSFNGGPVATFTDPDVTRQASDFIALVNFDDHQGYVKGTVTAAANGGYVVSATPPVPLTAGQFGLPFDQGGLFVLIEDNHNGDAGKGGPMSFGYAPFSVGTPNQRFVTELYLDLLGRAVDSGGLAFWSGLLDSQLTSQHAPGFSRAQVALGIESSLEYHIREVQALYQKLLGRTADPGGLAGWLTYLAQGGTFLDMEDLILGSSEFFVNHGGATSAGFVKALYEDLLGRAPGAGELAEWKMLVDNGVSGATVAGMILGSSESETDRVQAYYELYLHRAADPSGLAGFVNALNQGVPDEDVIAGILASDEYLAKVQPASGASP